METLQTENLKLLAPWLIDSEGKRRNVPLVVKNQNDKMYLDLSVDTKDLKFPITIDPTILTYSGRSDGIKFNSFSSDPSGSSWTPDVGFFSVNKRLQ
ncbi:hypothetical protein [Cohnella rhizosphaerae]|uniref:Uncharacterized protein n=1 Tax=Cohnella rhizosphaerae TaxID=1457232 RepID=A0A9X4L0Y3_9BACL|nr:hypothetical protein [Cohnella rhizosphaerae]MDG0814208.1 hypothetical protein [Cohnella rhizosphaerae]